MGQRFEDFPEVDCNFCSHYYNDTCDGHTSPLQGSERLCTAFRVVRGVDIPLKIKTLQRACIGLVAWDVVLTAGFIVLALWSIIYGG